MAFNGKEFFYNEFSKEPLGGSCRLTVDDSGRVFSVYTPHDPRLNSKWFEIDNPAPELVAELLTEKQEVLAMLQKVVFDPDTADREIRGASDRVFLEDSGIDPTSI
jgi:hypothetical protein